MTNKTDHTENEQRILDAVAERKSEEFAEANADFILTEASVLGIGDWMFEDDTAEKMAESAIERIQSKADESGEGN